jgi:hypothetical protein
MVGDQTGLIDTGEAKKTDYSVCGWLFFLKPKEILDRPILCLM